MSSFELSFHRSTVLPGNSDVLFSMHLTTDQPQWLKHLHPLAPPFVAVRSYRDLCQLRDALGGDSVSVSAPFPRPPSAGLFASGASSSQLGLVSVDAVVAFLRALLASPKYSNAKPLVDFFVDLADVPVYDTASMCPRCVLHERRGVKLEHAAVVRRQCDVFLTISCAHGHRTRTKVCGDYLFFARQLAFATPSAPTPRIGDIETLGKRLSERPTASDAPFVVQIPLFESGAFRSDDAIRSDVELSKTFYPANRKFIVKALAGAAMDMDELNRKALFLVSILPDRPLLLELTYERLVVLCEREDSCFVKAGIYPAVKYFVEAGNEAQCEAELVRLCDTVSQFEGIQVTITIVAELPIENLRLQGVLNLLRSRPSLVRVVTFQLVRSPKSILSATATATVAAPASNNDSSNVEQCLEAPDPAKFLQLLESASSGELRTSDFVPASVGVCLEPILSVMGHGFYFLRASPFCATATCLVNTTQHRSVPLTRLFDVEKFWVDMVPLLPHLQDGKVGLFNAKRLQKTLRACLQSDIDLWPYLTASSHAAATRNFIDHLQFVIVHNHMDIAAADVVRRCQCAVIAVDSARGFVASCTGCL
jgi:hypothetical protein